TSLCRRDPDPVRRAAVDHRNRLPLDPRPERHAGKLVVRDRSGIRTDPDRLPTHRDRSASGDTTPEQRYFLEIRAVLAGRLESDAAKLARDVIGRLHVAQLTRGAAEHRIRGKDVEAGL